MNLGEKPTFNEFNNPDFNNLNLNELKYDGSFRLLIHPKMEGRLNMAIDEALLETIENPQNPPIIRFYGFSPATLTYGRFQRIKEIINLKNLNNDGISFVRRPTGGHAVLHDDEVTYSVILSRKHIEPFRKRNVYNFIAKILLAGLTKLGVDARINVARIGDIHNPNCFATRGEYEIVSKDGKKLIGSAQTTTRYGALQHGAIPIGASLFSISRYLNITSYSKETGNASDYATYINRELKNPVTFDKCIEVFSMALKEILPVKISELTSQEKKRADQLFKEKYNTEEWNYLY